jgi:hypothetical protein
MTTQLGTPRGRYDEHSSKSSLNMKPRFIEPVGERTNFQRLILASFAMAPDNLYMAPRPGHSFAPTTTRSLTQHNQVLCPNLQWGCQSHWFAVNKRLSVSSGER